MAYTITRLCIDCKDTACADVCPVECIYEHTGGGDWPNQLYIHPDDCIDCSNCEPACPWRAIFPADEVPTLFAADIDLNTKITEHLDEFEVARVRKHPKPTEDAIQSNFGKYNYKP